MFGKIFPACPTDEALNSSVQPLNIEHHQHSPPGAWKRYGLLFALNGTRGMSFYKLKLFMLSEASPFNSYLATTPTPTTAC